MARVLLVDDDPALLDVLGLALEDAGHVVTRALDGAAAKEVVDEGAIDIVVSDVNMPKLDGFALVRALRAEGVAIPILLLTARDDEIDEALGLELGADDYVAKPFATRVLLARIAALVRRDALRQSSSSSSADDGERIARGALTIDVARMDVRYADQPIVVTLTELRLLHALAARPGVVQTREMLLSRARDDDSVVDARIVDTYVRRLRRKLEAIDPTFAAIETVIGAGYRWTAKDG